MKHVPERTCVACRTKRPKRELLRVVRTPQGDIGMDPGGRQAGRGAYFCRAQECWTLGLRKGSLEHALKTRLLPDDRSRLLEYIRELPAKAAEAEE